MDAPPRLRRLLLALPPLAFAGAFAATWVAPATFGPGAVDQFYFLGLLEMLAVFLTALAVVPFVDAEGRARVRGGPGWLRLWALVPALGVLAIAQFFDQVQAAVVFLAFTGTRWALLALRPPTLDDVAEMRGAAAGHFLVVMAALLLAVALPWPEFGVPVDRVPLHQERDGSTLELGLPANHMMAFGTVAFLLHAAWEARGLSARVGRADAERRAAAGAGPEPGPGGRARP